MSYICRNCGNKINFECGEETIYCTGCQSEISRPKDVIHTTTFTTRVEQIKAMHEIMCNANDENIYMSWIYVMPDCATQEDFEYIAADDESYNECFDLFVKLIADEGNRW
jgi:hypothetical protein